MGRACAGGTGHQSKQETEVLFMLPALRMVCDSVGEKKKCHTDLGNEDVEFSGFLLL